jgi:hypothetical protein
MPKGDEYRPVMGGRLGMAEMPISLGMNDDEIAKSPFCSLREHLGRT